VNIRTYFAVSKLSTTGFAVSLTIGGDLTTAGLGVKALIGGFLFWFIQKVLVPLMV
jgi:hypothetical protein